MIGFFCKRALPNRWYSAKETYNFNEPTNRSHPISIFQCTQAHVYLFKYIYAQTYSHVYTRKRKKRDASHHARWYVCTLWHTYMCIHTNMFTCVHAKKEKNWYVASCTLICIYITAYINMYLHSNTYIHSNLFVYMYVLYVIHIYVFTF